MKNTSWGIRVMLESGDKRHNGAENIDARKTLIGEGFNYTYTL
ncbi:hypothetical protein [Paenibacillus albidus]|nr:hypothetical protein [Paenibacillus albidus]